MSGRSGKNTAPGVADQDIRSWTSGVIPLHAAVLVEDQDVGLDSIGGEDSLVRVRLEEDTAVREAGSKTASPPGRAQRWHRLQFNERRGTETNRGANEALWSLL